MAEPSDPAAAGVLADRDLWALLRRSVSERAPEDVRVSARTALSWRDPEAALATLVADSSAPEAEMIAPVRSGGQSRLLAFASADISIDVEVSEEGDEATLIGQLAPVGPAEIAVDHDGGVAVTVADELGRFRIDGIGRGPVRLRCAPHTTGAPVHTEWVLL